MVVEMKRSDFNNLPYLWHDFCNLSHDTSIAIVGHTPFGKNKSFKTDVDKCKNVGWLASLSNDDKSMAEKYDFSAELSIKHADFVLLSYETEKETQEALLSKMSEIFPLTKNYNHAFYSFSVYFAHLHDDRGISKVRGQLNYIHENKAEHSILSVDVHGKHHLVTPKAGDWVFFDVHCQHAVIPNQSKGVRYMRSHPLKAIYTQIDEDSYD